MNLLGVQGSWAPQEGRLFPPPGWHLLLSAGPRLTPSSVQKVYAMAKGTAQTKLHDDAGVLPRRRTGAAQGSACHCCWGGGHAPHC